MIYDLHAHSNASDGLLRPQEVVERANARGVDVLALTDHDTLRGLAEARAAAGRLGLRLISGIEFSTQWSGRGVHLVGLNFDVDDTRLQAVVAGQHQRRVERGWRIADQLAKAGVIGALEGAQRLAGGELTGRPHFARYLVEGGYVPSMAAAFKRYLGAGKIGDVSHDWLDMEEIIDAIRHAGGVAVLAHPAKYSLTRAKILRLASFFKDRGGEGFEVVSGMQSPLETRTLVQMAQAAGLYASCGSDFHMPDQPWQDLGVCGKLPDLCEPVWQLWH